MVDRTKVNGVYKPSYLSRGPHLLRFVKLFYSYALPTQTYISLCISWNCHSPRCTPQNVVKPQLSQGFQPAICFTGCGEGLLMVGVVNISDLI